MFYHELYGVCLYYEAQFLTVDMSVYIVTTHGVGATDNDILTCAVTTVTEMCHAIHKSEAPHWYVIP